MSRKQISPAKVKGVTAAFKAVGENLKDNASDLIESSATENFAAATTEAKSLSAELEVTVNSLDQFLNGVADEMEGVDASLARTIEENTGGAVSALGVLANAASNKHYKTLP